MEWSRVIPISQVKLDVKRQKEDHGSFSLHRETYYTFLEQHRQQIVHLRCANATAVKINKFNPVEFGRKLDEIFQRVKEMPFDGNLLNNVACFLRERCAMYGISALAYDPKCLDAGVDASIVRASLVECPVARGFIVKVPQNDSHEMLNEFIVGTYALNHLRTKIPNFMYIYAGLFASKSVKKMKKINIPTEETGNKMLYTAVEEIHGIQLADFSGTIEQNDAIMAQIYLTLAFGQEFYDFSHNDLHAGNILVEDLKKEFTILYPFSNGTYFVRSRYLARIIDYGKAHVRVPVSFTSKKVKDDAEKLGYNIYKDGYFNTGILDRDGTTEMKNYSLNDIVKITDSMAEYTKNKKEIYDWITVLFKNQKDVTYDNLNKMFNQRFSGTYKNTIQIRELINYNLNKIPRLGAVVKIGKGIPKGWPAPFACSNLCNSAVPGVTGNAINTTKILKL